MESLVAVVISLHAGSLRQLASLYCIGGSSRVQQPSEWPSSSLQACSALYHRMRGLENSLTSSWLAYHSWQGVFQIWEMIKNEVAHTRNRECQAREAYCSSDQDKHQHRQEEGGTICDEDVIFTPEPEFLWHREDALRLEAIFKLRRGGLVQLSEGGGWRGTSSLNRCFWCTGTEQACPIGQACSAACVAAATAAPTPLSITACVAAIHSGYISQLFFYCCPTVGTLNTHHTRFSGIFYSSISSRGNFISGCYANTEALDSTGKCGLKPA